MNNEKRKFPWKTWKSRHSKNHRGHGFIHIDALEGQWFFLVMGGIWLLIGLLVGIFNHPAFLVIGLLIGLPCCGLSVYCRLSRKEELEIEAKRQAERDEKQRIWREKRRQERSKQKPKNKR
ncbi:MAG: hypothetical protein E7451_08915 [Ruminococcaceae bacterium]|nr:hypothetical protein [Oscillospiraceae bacterium]